MDYSAPTAVYPPFPDPQQDPVYWTGTLAAFMIGFTLFMFMFVLVIRVSLALTRASLDRRVRPRSAWVTMESGQVIRGRRCQQGNPARNQLMTDAPPSYNDVCFAPPAYSQSTSLPPLNQPINQSISRTNNAPTFN